MHSVERAAPAPRIDVAVVEGDEGTRQEICRALAADPSVALFASTASSAELLPRLKPTSVAVIICDVDTAEAETLAFCRTISEHYPGIKVILHSQAPDQLSLAQVSHSGANGVLDKSQSLANVVPGVHAAARGLFVTNSLRIPLDDGAIAMPDTSAALAETQGDALTDREHEVLTLMAEGMGNREIATQLFISENTVKNHVRSILEKFNQHSRMAAVVYAVRQRILNIT